MREQTLALTQPFHTGLRVEERAERNSTGLVDCRGLVVTPRGLEMPPDIVPIVEYEGGAWPQIIRGRSLVLVCYSDSIYKLEDGLLISISTFDLSSIEEAKDITPGGQWHMMDFGSTWLLFNGACTVACLNNVTTGEQVAYVQDTISVQSGTAYMGRGVMVGFDPQNFWSTEWQDIYGAWLDKADEQMHITFDKTMELGENFVYWSSIGGGDVMFPFSPTGMTYGLSAAAHTIERPLWIEQMKKNQWGFMPVEWSGAILCTKQIGRHCVVYGEGGISALYATQVGETATMGMTTLQRGAGIPQRCCVGGDRGNHVFLDAEGDLWFMAQDLGLQRVGFKEFFRSFVADTPISISHDDKDNTFYISIFPTAEEPIGYALTSTGLTRISSVPSSLYYGGGSLRGSVVSATPQQVQIETDTFDLGLQVLKTIRSVAISAIGLSDIEASLGTRITSSGAWIWQPYRRANVSGIVTLQRTGLDFRLRIRGTASLDAKIEGVQIHWVGVDNRDIRGAQANVDR
jgi:hypothetical protein